MCWLEHLQVGPPYLAGKTHGILLSFNHRCYNVPNRVTKVRGFSSHLKHTD